MTALSKYQRLEATALWRSAPGVRAIEVVAGLREATLILTDPRSETPLSQWSLPAVTRLNPGQMPARFAPGLDADEELELDDPEMIAALATVHKALERRKPHPGRLRAVVLGGTALLVVGIVVFWLPERLKSYTASVLPAPTRADLGEMALADIARLTGQPCKSVPGRRAAQALADRLFPNAPPRIEILRDALTAPAHLPGNILLLPARLVESADGPEALAGHLLDESLRATTTDPVDPLLSHIGLGATLRLLTTGTVPEGSLQGFGEPFLTAPRAPAPDADTLLAAFQTAQSRSAPYGEVLDGPEDLTRALIDQDPFPLGAPTPVMSDEDWLELQAICTE